ncbi:hypothetical protein [Rudaea sp.]|uniref:hypothetical protein n=1 Tax=Rudaea sp. TaxID=2136325 RepID=UPI002ED50D3F
MTETNEPNRLAAWLETAWLERYLDRQLSAEEVAWFETYVIDKPDLLQKIDMDSDLWDGVIVAESKLESLTEIDAAITSRDASHHGERRVAAGIASKSSRPVATTTNGRISLDAEKHARTHRWLRLAAAVVIGAGLGGMTTFRLNKEIIPSVIGSPTRVIYDTVRGDAIPPRVESDSRISEYVLLETPAPYGATEIEVTIGDVQPIPVVPGADGYISILIRDHTFENAKTAILSYRIDGKLQQQSLDLTNIKRIRQ